MRIDIITLFPGMFQGPLTESILQRAQDEGHLSIHFHDLRDFGIGNYRQVDDKPYGGGAGMLLRVDVVVAAIELVAAQAAEDSFRLQVLGSKFEKPNLKPKTYKPKTKPYIIYLSPCGQRLTQSRVETLAKKHEWLVLLCGHYEGIDQRVIDGGWVDQELSIGDYVLTGGELPAMVLIDAIARHIPGVLGDDESAAEESFSPALDRKKEYPHYTRPEEFRDLKVPNILISGHHEKIEEWRRENLR